MNRPENRLTVGYLGAHLKTYYAEEYSLFDESIQGLNDLGVEFGFRVLAAKMPVVSAVEAERELDVLMAEGIDFLIVHHATFVMGDVIKRVARCGVPLGLWTHPEPSTEGGILFNGFVSLDMSASIIRRYLRDDAIRYKWFYGDTKHPWFRDRLAVTISAMRAKKTLQRGSVGLIGGIAPTFYNFTFDERRIADSIGLQVFHHELKEIFDRVDGIDSTRVRTISEEICVRTENRVTVSDRDLSITSSVYAALEDFSKEHNYTGLAVSDWPVFQQELDIHPGFAFSWLEDKQKIPVASEGDVMGAATMILINAISLQETYLLDMAAIDTDKDAMLMWHCGGSPLSLADNGGVGCVNHSMLGRKVPNGRVTGAVADLIFRTGPVTVGRLSDDGNVLFSMEANVISTESRGYDGCRGWVGDFSVGETRISLGDVVTTVLDEGLEHHFGLVAGKHMIAAKEWAYWAGARCVAPIRYTNGRSDIN